MCSGNYFLHNSPKCSAVLCVQVFKGEGKGFLGHLARQRKSNVTLLLKYVGGVNACCIDIKVSWWLTE